LDTRIATDSIMTSHYNWTCYFSVKSYRLECAKEYIRIKLAEGPGCVFDWGLELTLPQVDGRTIYTFGFDVCDDYQPNYSMGMSLNKIETCTCDNCEVTQILYSL
jgi:hypothetical protein